MEFLLEFLAEFIFEFFFQVIGSIIDGSISSLGRLGIVFKLIFYAVLGSVLGLISFAIWSTPLWGTEPNLLLSLLVVPIAVAIAIVAVSRWEERHRDWEVGMSRFAYSFVFAWTFSALRYVLLVKNAVLIG